MNRGRVSIRPQNASPLRWSRLLFCDLIVVKLHVHNIGADDAVIKFKNGPCHFEQCDKIYTYPCYIYCKNIIRNVPQKPKY